MGQLKLRHEIPWAVRWGLVLCVAQILFCLVFSSVKNGVGVPQYFNLVQWDSLHYLDIVENGYHLPVGQLTAEDVHTNRANVGYFPAYPFIAKGIHKLLGVSSSLSLLATAQFFTFLFWVQLLLLLRLLNVPRRLSLFVSATVAVYPASFFMVAGYSESIFLASLIGYILWTEYEWARKEGPRIGLCFGVAAMWGILLSSSRLVGIPLVCYPAVRVLSQRVRFNERPFRLGVLLSFIASLGALSFFGGCKYWFGEWNIYLKLQQLGWGNKPNYLGLIDPRSYIPKLFFEDTVNSVCRGSNLFILVLLIVSVRGEILSGFKSVEKRLGFYFCAASIFFVSLSGKANYNMDSMVRYNLPVFVILVLILIQQMELNGRIKWNKRLWGFGYLLAWVVQAWMIHLFTKGGWVA